MAKVGRPKNKKKKLTIEEMVSDESGEIVSIGAGTKEHNARKFKKMAENKDYNTSPTKTNRGMYAGSADPESFIEMYKKSVANRQKKGSPWTYVSRKAVEDEIYNYFEFCVDRRIPVTVAGLCAWVGISVATLSVWKRNQGTQPYYDIFDSAVAFIHAMTEQGAVEGNIPASVFNFISRNYHGLKDSMDYFVAPQEDRTMLEQQNIINMLPEVRTKSHKNE